MTVSNCLFPVKLLALVNEAAKSISWGKDRHGLTDYPEDGLTRIMLMTPEMHQAFDDSYTNESTRFRLAVPKDIDHLVAVYEQTRVEVYSANELLLGSYTVNVLNRQQAMAVQIELMYMIIQANGGYINSL